MKIPDNFENFRENFMRIRKKKMLIFLELFGAAGFQYCIVAKESQSCVAASDLSFFYMVSYWHSAACRVPVLTGCTLLQVYASTMYTVD